ncbi:Cyclopentanone 1,2-monooxygenase [Fonsecaea pedrosoi]|nr:Cyclopentanone 1,2-monooxygenase [Fonsecaea pedrosoi]
MGSIAKPEIPSVDVLIVGAGFGAFTLLNKLRKQGLSVKIYERGPAAGGIWFWNCYPGARVDSESPIYQLFDRDLYEDFTFKERYSSWPDLRRYFKYIEKKWNTEEYIEYNRNVETAIFDEQRHQWHIECSDGTEVYAQWFMPCVGFASKHYKPPFPGLQNFKGPQYHTAFWPQHGVNLKGKRVALIGTGASGIQVAQEIGDVVKHLTIFQRTPNLCLPMKQWELDPEVERKKKADGEYERIFDLCRKSFTGFHYTFSDKNTFDDTPEEREKFYKSLWDEAGFVPLLKNLFFIRSYKDMLFDQKANDEAYKYWRSTVLKRVKNPEKQRLLAPEKPPHPFGTKRNSLEQRFYEVVDQDHIDIVDVKENPVLEVTETGIRTPKGHVEYDVIILATGFDSVTGSLAQMDIHSTDGGTVADHWKDGLRTAMGIALAGFPNMFFLYGPQSPTAFANGPSNNQFQAEWVDKVLTMCREEGITRIEATREAEDEWSKKANELWYKTLYPKANGWYNGANIPGKRVEPMNWIGGMVPYVAALHNSLENGYQGWRVSKLNEQKKDSAAVKGEEVTATVEHVEGDEVPAAAVAG